FTSKGFSRIDVNTNGGAPKDTLAGHLRGTELKSADGFGVPAESYEFANKRMAWETIAPLLERASPLRSAHLRDPVGPQIHFASESFIDEIAAAEKSGWQSRPSPRKDQTGNTASGRGMAYAQRNGTRVAIVADVDIDRRS